MEVLGKQRVLENVGSNSFGVEYYCLVEREGIGIFGFILCKFFCLQVQLRKGYFYNDSYSF